MRLHRISLSLAVAFLATVWTVAGKSGPTAVAYVEVNSNSILNVGKYKLSDRSNAFDVAIIFAANINYNGSAAVLYNNPQVQAVLNDAANQIVPLQRQGIKVVLSILGNHQGAGIANFPSQAAATNFAVQVRNAVTKYGLDGVDLDDEYADYGANGLPQPNQQSIGWLLTALRSNLPSKLITFYNIGPAADSLSTSSATIGAKLDDAWNPFYGTYSAPSIPGLNKTRLSPAAVQITSTSASDAASFARRTVADGYGAYMTYDLRAGNFSTYISGITQGLYGLKTTYTG